MEHNGKHTFENPVFIYLYLFILQMRFYYNKLHDIIMREFHLLRASSVIGLYNDGRSIVLVSDFLCEHE